MNGPSNSFDTRGVLILRLMTGVSSSLSFIATSLVLIFRLFPCILSLSPSSSTSPPLRPVKTTPSEESLSPQKKRSPTSVLVLFLILNDWALSVSDLLSMFLPVDGILPFDRQASLLCIAQGFLVQMFTLSSYLWPFTLALHAFLTVVVQLKPKTLASLVPFYVTCNFFLPLIPALVAFALRYYGLPDPYHTFPVWCWVRAEFVAFRLGALYLPFFVTWILSAVVFILVIRALRQVGPNLAKSATRRIVLYLGIFLLGYFPGFCNRILDIFGYQSYWLYALQCCCDPLVGFADSIVYGLTPARRHYILNIFEELRGWIGRYCCLIPSFSRRSSNSGSLPINSDQPLFTSDSSDDEPRITLTTDESDSHSNRRYH